MNVIMLLATLYCADTPEGIEKFICEKHTYFCIETATDRVNTIVKAYQICTKDD